MEPLERRVLLAGDVTVPIATLISAPTTNPAGQPVAVTVKFSDNVAIDPNTIGDGNIYEFGASGLIYGNLLSKAQNNDGSWTAKFQLQPPAIPGLYELDTTAVFQVADTSGNVVPSYAIGTFTQSAQTGGGGGTGGTTTDTTVPTATLTAAPLRSNGNASYDFSVTYADDTKLDQTTISSTNIRVTGPQGYSQLATLLGVTATTPPTGTGGTGTTTGDAVIAQYRVPAPAVPGTYNISVVQQQVADSSKNFVAPGVIGSFTGLPTDFGTGTPGTVIVPGKHTPPDLAARFVGAIPARGSVGGQGIVKVRVSNLGNSGVSSKIPVSLFATSNQVLGSSDTFLASKTVKSLRGGANKIVKMRFNYGDLAPGTYYLAAEADPDNIIPESSETNNTGFTPTTVTVDAPFIDLGASIVGNLPSTAMGGMGGSIKLRVSNNGNVAFDRSLDVTLFTSTDQVLDAGDAVIGTGSVNVNVQPGSPTDTKLSFTYPSNLADGNYYVLAKINAGPAVADANPANDVGVSSDTVFIVRPVIDLTPTSVLVSNPRGAVALTTGTNNVDVLVRNLGNDSANGPLTISLAAVPTGSATSTAIPLASTTFNNSSVKTDKLARYTLTFQLPASIPSGSYSLRATVDADNHFAESNELNNDVLSSPVTIVQII